jgi:hypothetical protein
MRGHSRFLSIELPVPAGSLATKFSFTDTQTAIMRSDVEKDVAIYSITTYHDLSLPVSVGNNAVATPAQVQNAFLTLYILGNEALKQMSMQRFLNQQNAGAANNWNNREYFETAPLRVDWTNSFVELAAANVDPDLPAYSFIFEFEYEWLPPGSIGKYLQNRNNKWAAGILY